jgi:WD40 repeat protein
MPLIKKLSSLIFCLTLDFLLITLLIPSLSFAEEKPPSGPAQVIPKIPKTPNDPELFNGHVYPFWGPVCMRYTYSVVYRDKEGRPPEYVKIYFNGQMIDMEKENPADNNYKKGVKYIYKFVPNKLGSNFYYFEASNGKGKARDSIIDSPDNGPVLFESDFSKNEIALIEPKSASKISSFPTGKEWVGGVALSADGKYLAAKTSRHIYLFETPNIEKPLWEFLDTSCKDCPIGGDVKGGVDISADGSKIIAAIGNRVLLFNKNSNKPIWSYETDNSYNVAISQDGRYAGAATAGEEENLNSNLLILWETDKGKPLWKYHSSGNFHDVSLSADGKYIAGSTGCPDRKFYLFSKDSNTPLIKTEMLTRDSPVSRAKISADGSLIAVGSESDAGAVFLFSKDQKEPLWKFPTGMASVRALSFTPDGRYIAAATFVGDIYLFEKESNQPKAHWQIPETALGGIDIADDGSFLAVGGVDNKVHIFEKDSQEGKEILFNEFVEEIDISANGKYIAAGTGGSVYFFESFAKKEDKIFPCTTIIEPPKEPEEGFLGIDKPLSEKEPSQIFLIFFTLGFLISFLSVIGYLAIIKFNLLKRPPEKLLKFKKRVIIPLIILMGIFFILMLITGFYYYKIEQTSPISSPQKEEQEENQTSAIEMKKENQTFDKAVCGNNLCEPDLGESKENCSQDCPGED